jgi:crooked neck
MGDFGEGPLGTKLGQGATAVKYPRPTRVKNKTPAPTQVRRRAAERAHFLPSGPRLSIPPRGAPCVPPSHKHDQTSTCARYPHHGPLTTYIPQTHSPPPRVPPKQITAEQIVREAKEHQEEAFKAPALKIADVQELQEYRLKKRKEFEDNIRRVYWNESVWVKYAKWEESQGDFQRARSVWERSLDHHHRSVSIWLKYAEMEMVNRFVNHARNVWDRAVTLLPRVDQLWYKYVHMEEMLGLPQNARVVFNRWMGWEPDHNGWNAFVRFEVRYEEWDHAREVFKRYCQCHPSVKAFTRFAKFEFGLGEVANARAVYENAVEEMQLEVDVDQLYVAFAKFETLAGETERARGIYKFALDNLPKEKAVSVFQSFSVFEKQNGSREGIEDVVLGKKRVSYENDVRQNPHNYDAWFDYARMEESCGGDNFEKTREVYERAIANVPPAPEKRYWKRYIFLWINYALFEELETKDVEKAREVYRECLKLIPHREFSFSKIWILAAKFEIRAKRLDAARKILGTAIGLAPKAKIFEYYCDIEMQLGNVDRCRVLYQKALETEPTDCGAWVRFAELEKYLGETERARAVYELATSRDTLDAPEVLWKSFVDFEIAEGERVRARALYERLLDRTKHVKVWMSYALFEAAPMGGGGGDEEEDDTTEKAEARASDSEEETVSAREIRAREVYERALRCLKETAPDAKEERVMLLEAWRSFEGSRSDGGDVSLVESKMPKRVKRKRAIFADDGAPAGQEEYYDYIFPEEQGAAPNLKILEAAYAWKKRRTE